TVFSIRDESTLTSEVLQSAVQGWQASGHSVYWIGDETLALESGLSLKDSFGFTFSTPQMETSYESKPVRILDIVWNLEIHRLG
ncbi:MAG: hypothetical protein ACK2T3_03400, partial [Candidatus Promineifilaceae bacterium]